MLRLYNLNRYQFYVLFGNKVITLLLFLCINKTIDYNL